jgi:hypothetical protein
MTFKKRLVGAFIGLGICIASMPVAVVATIVLVPFWSWLERTMAIETVGHSGPAEWCYLFIYVIVLSLAAVVWSKIGRRRQKADK